MAEIGKREGPQKLCELAYPARVSRAVYRRGDRPGNHPPELTAQALITRRIDLPLHWHEQKAALQF